jgi:hypothetical protein
LITGVALGILAADDRLNLVAKKLPDSMYYDGLRISREQVFAQQTAINNKWTAAGVLAGVAAVAGGLGVWALLSAPGKVAVTSGPGTLGAGLAVEF